jgi:hypothetical protein
MSFFTNKHVIIALIVAPILAVVSYYSVDLLVKETPQTAQAGSSYPLIAQSNCRYTSGRCDLANNEFAVQLRVAQLSDSAWLLVEAKAGIVLQGITVGFARADRSLIVPPQRMEFDAARNRWQIVASQGFENDTQLMIVLQANDVRYYAETAMTFSEYQTAYGKSLNEAFNESFDK